jgi:hypothetical protein
VGLGPAAGPGLGGGEPGAGVVVKKQA